jgi:hypothetical protein
VRLSVFDINARICNFFKRRVNLASLRFVIDASTDVFWNLSSDALSKRNAKYLRKMEVHPIQQYDYAQHSRADKYFRIAREQDKWVEPFVKYWNRDPRLAYLYYMQDEYAIAFHESLLDGSIVPNQNYTRSDIK